MTNEAVKLLNHLYNDTLTYKLHQAAANDGFRPEALAYVEEGFTKEDLLVSKAFFQWLEKHNFYFGSATYNTMVDLFIKHTTIIDNWEGYNLDIDPNIQL